MEVSVSDLWVVLVPHGKEVVVYGPMEAVEAQPFARFMSKEVEPCEIRKLCSPLREMLAWYEQETARNSCTHGADCPVHPDVQRIHGMLDEAMGDLKAMQHNRKE